MQYIFTTSNDISDSVSLTFDMKSRTITLKSCQKEKPILCRLSLPLDSLFEQMPREEIDRMIPSELKFRESSFERILNGINSFIESGRATLQLDDTLALEVLVDNFSDVVVQNSTDYRTLTSHELVQLLIGYLNAAQFKQYLEKLLQDEKRHTAMNAT